MKKQILLYVLAAAISGVFAGCGGSPSTSKQTSNVIRQIQVGDLVTYSVTGEHNLGTSSSYSKVAGQITMSVQAGTLSSAYGGRPLNMVIDIYASTVVPPTSSIVPQIHTGKYTKYYEQVADGTVYELRHVYEGHSFLLTSTDNGVAPIRYKSPVAVGYTYGYTGHYSCADMDILDYTRQTSSTVVSTEPVNNKMSYKIHTTHTTDGIDGNKSLTNWFAPDDEWFVPDWGYPIQLNLTEYGDGTWVLTGVLKTKNF